MPEQQITITAISSISSLGKSTDDVWDSYRKEKHLFEKRSLGNHDDWMAPLSQKAKRAINLLRSSDAKYENLDDTVLYALYASRQAIKKAGWKQGDDFGINIGSSRGATTLFEKYHENFRETGKVSPLSSPTTTLGNISSWIAHDLKTKGPEISHSITCSTALHAVLNGMAWINSGMADRFLVGGSEAPLTAFTLAQMKALKIYANGQATTGHTFYPCRALDMEKRKNSMVLGEGASIACLEKGVRHNSLAVIEGIGYATEPLEHYVSISSDAHCFQRSMEMALNDLAPEYVDVIVMHTPGTIKGDLSEYKAIKKVFCNKTPFLTTNKWIVGHTFGASGMLSIEMAILMLQHQEVIRVPFAEDFKIPSKIRKVMVNSVGFGGNAVSILLSI
ncbi:beta-ketoacyl synthase N-terminal-like domain-containing protein [Ulvibacterium marinum]|uniref:Beta-ketoacyl synthase n=1 Tax=Ulvibacterium marinum TaxID=2419782 RepID=A0A3B0CGG7_9FLAO|nr:beta-ketoacyl synthase N-terminal-like domain-containing protein [Ulvibacterium marinum]RKN83127.1 beta-ketoacyl synthase [Ulvibacterium marinum]